MLDTLFTGIFDADATQVISVSQFLICVVCALVAGLILAFAYMYKSRYTKSFVVTLAMLPAVVCVVIMMVNGNVGTGVAVAGAFSLVRFRSAVGTAKEIGALFLAMGSGLIIGMGYIAYSFLFTIILCGVMVLYGLIDLGAKRSDEMFKTLHITIPEDLDYTNVFGDIFDKYTESYKLTHVKTTNMGSLFKLTYDIELIKPETEKELIDDLRCRNGNLEISISNQETSTVAAL